MNPFANAGDLRDTGPIPGLGRSPGGESGDPLQYSCLESSMDRGAWWATVHKVAETEATWRAHTVPPPQALLICHKGDSLRSTVSSPEKPTFHYKLRNTEVVYPLTGAWNHVS